MKKIEGVNIEKISEIIIYDPYVRAYPRDLEIDKYKNGGVIKFNNEKEFIEEVDKLTKNKQGNVGYDEDWDEYYIEYMTI